MRIAGSLRRWVGILTLPLACVSMSSLGQDERYRHPSGLKPALKVLPVPETVAVEPASSAPVLPKIEFLDPTNPDLPLLQRYGDAVRDLPVDPNGFPDWMKALKEGKIKPRSGLRADAGMDVLDLDVIMKNTKEMPNVRFPHRSHTLWLACSNCHPEPFQAKAGSTAIVMADIFRGQFCGVCHDRVAFVTFFSCQRCHSVPRQEPR